MRSETQKLLDVLETERRWSKIATLDLNRMMCGIVISAGGGVVVTKKTMQSLDDYALVQEVDMATGDIYFTVRKADGALMKEPQPTSEPTP